MGPSLFARATGQYAGSFGERVEKLSTLSMSAAPNSTMPRLWMQRLVRPAYGNGQSTAWRLALTHINVHLLPLVKARMDNAVAGRTK